MRIEMTEEKLITTRELCDRLGVTRQAVYKWRRLKGNPMPVAVNNTDKNGKTIRYLYSDVVEWLNGTITNNGIAVYLTSSDEAASASYYTKRFYSRTSEYILKKPALEARYNDSKIDDASTFYLSSALAPASDNLNNLYLYNYVGGQLANLPSVGTSDLLLSVYSGSTSPLGSKLFLPVGGGVATPGDDNVTILLCGVTDDLAHLINDPNGLVSVEWSATVNGQPNGPCTSPVELKMKAHIEPEKEEVDDWWNNEITESRLKKKVLKEQTGELKGLRELGDYLELLIDKRWISLEIAQRIFDLSVIDVDYLLDNIMDWCEGED